MKRLWLLCVLFSQSLYAEMDTFSIDLGNDLWTKDKSDRYLTNVIGFYIRTKELPHFLKTFLPDMEADYFLTKVSQDMYTPENIENEIPDEMDHPYAGHLYIEVRKVVIQGRIHDYTTLQFGIIGPAALAEQAQSLVHDLTKSTTANGWAYQLENEFGINISKLVGLKTDLYEWGEIRLNNISFAEAGLGNVKVFAGVGTKFYAGFNPPRNDSVYEVAGQTYSSNMSLYLETDLRHTYVGRDIFIDGNSSWFGERTKLKREEFVTTSDISVVARVGNFFLRLTQSYSSEQFKTQPNPHGVGKISIQYRTFF